MRTLCTSYRATTLYYTTVSSFLHPWAVSRMLYSQSAQLQASLVPASTQQCRTTPSLLAVMCTYPNLYCRYREAEITSFVLRHLLLHNLLLINSMKDSTTKSLCHWFVRLSLDTGKKNCKFPCDKAIPGFEPGFWEYHFKIPSDNHYTIWPLFVWMKY